MNINDIRRLNLDYFIGEPGKHGRIADFARKFGQDPSYLSQILNKNRNMGEKAARTMEQAFELPEFSLDRPMSPEVADAAARDLANSIGPDAVTLLDLYLAASQELRVAALRVLETPQHPYSVQPIKKPQE